MDPQKGCVPQPVSVCTLQRMNRADYQSPCHTVVPLSLLLPYTYLALYFDSLSIVND